MKTKKMAVMVFTFLTIAMGSVSANAGEGARCRYDSDCLSGESCYGGTCSGYGGGGGWDNGGWNHGGGSCNSQLYCSECYETSRTCRTIDCNGNVKEIWNERCNG